MIKCEACVMFEDINGNVGLCKMNPPVFVDSDFPNSTKGYSQPMVDAIGGCGKGYCVEELEAPDVPDVPDVSAEEQALIEAGITTQKPVVPQPQSESRTKRKKASRKK